MEIPGRSGKSVELELEQAETDFIILCVGGIEHDDERHICPLQLDVIDRCLELWSTEGDVVLSPFAGIGSEGYEAVKMGRKFIGIELKKSYFDQAVINLKSADIFGDQKTLF